MTQNTVTYAGKFTPAELGGLTIVSQCPKSYSELDIEDEIANCDHCSTVPTEHQGSSKCEAECAVVNADTKVKHNVVVSHSTLKVVVLISLE